MNYKSFLSVSMFVLMNTFLFNILLADISSNQTGNTEQLMQQKMPKDQQNTLSDTMQQKDKGETVLHKFAKYGTWYVVGGTAIFVVGLGSLAIHMLWQLANRNP